MSSGRRAYNMLRGYINREWDRMQGVDQDKAWRELNEMVGGKNAETEARQEVMDTAAGNIQQTPEDREEHARKLLGVTKDATFDDIRKTFERLSKRSDPKNFPDNSEEAKQAADIQKKVNWAFLVLTEKMDATEKRFKSLEI